MALMTFQDICLGFGGDLLLDHINFNIEPGERVCLIGRNGVGKTTLMKLISQGIEPDSGNIWKQQGICTSGISQQVPEHLNGTVFEVICKGLGSIGSHLARFHEISHKIAANPDPALLKEQERLQHMIDVDNGWQIQTTVENIISRMLPHATGLVETFSAGMKRQVLLAQALVSEPDILLLDEPTNHLDISVIARMEALLLKWPKTLFFVTHDRMLIKALATRIVEIDRGMLTSWDCNYTDYLKRKQQSLEAEDQQNARFDKKLSAEEVWIRKGIKARRTRNEGRVRALEKLREARRARRERTGKVRMQLQKAQKSGKIVIEADHIDFSYKDKKIVSDFSTTIMRGDKIGIIGPNGSGKTTLLRLLLGKLSPDNGKIRHGTHFEVIYFDQLRDQLEEEKTVQENIADGNDMLEINGRKRHVIGYLKDFLFSPQRSRTPVRVLSGGEKNRLLLAKMFTRPSNVMVLDEPTNDLDTETLELLEELLLEYDGTLLIVSHDRAFVNNVVTSTLVFESSGKIESFVGGYDDWQHQRQPDQNPLPKAGRAKKEKRQKPRQNGKKLGYLQARELESLPKTIEDLESKQADLFSLLSDPELFKRDPSTIAETKKQLADVESRLETAFERWEHLESLQAGGL